MNIKVNENRNKNNFSLYAVRSGLQQWVRDVSYCENLKLVV
jgi:hypothetical protein